MVIIPATTGQMGVLPGHVATIAKLKPEVFSVHEGDDVDNYFVSSGFAFIHANSSADIIAVEAVSLDHIDLSLVHKGLADFTQKMNSASTDLEKAEATVSRILGTITRTHTGLEDNQNRCLTFYSAIGSSATCEASCLSSWNVHVLVDSIKQLGPDINWINVVENLDHEETGMC